jgi:hypothetical protein
MAAFPRRRLLYSMPLVAPMRPNSGEHHSDLEVIRDGTKVKSPYIVELQLVSRGRKDIPSSSYDSSDPVQFAIGSKIIEILSLTATPSSPPPPKLSIAGSSIELGPSLIGKRQRIKITLLTEGRPSVLRCASPLIDVKMSNQFADEEEWIMEHRLGIGCFSWPLIYVGFGIAWAVAGSTVALIVLLASSLLLRLILLVVLAVRRKTMRVPDCLEVNTS